MMRNKDKTIPIGRQARQAQTEHEAGSKGLSDGSELLRLSEAVT